MLKGISDEKAAWQHLAPSSTVQWALNVSNLVFRLLPEERKNKVS